MHDGLLLAFRKNAVGFRFAVSPNKRREGFRDRLVVRACTDRSDYLKAMFP